MKDTPLEVTPISQFLSFCQGQVHPITGHEDPQGE